MVSALPLCSPITPASKLLLVPHRSRRSTRPPPSPPPPLPKTPFPVQRVTQSAMIELVEQSQTSSPLLSLSSHLNPLASPPYAFSPVLPHAIASRCLPYPPQAAAQPGPPLSPSPLPPPTPSKPSKPATGMTANTSTTPRKTPPKSPSAPSRAAAPAAQASALAAAPADTVPL